MNMDTLDALVDTMLSLSDGTVCYDCGHEESLHTTSRTGCRFRFGPRQGPVERKECPCTGFDPYGGRYVLTVHQVRQLLRPKGPERAQMVTE